MSNITNGYNTDSPLDIVVTKSLCAMRLAIIEMSSLASTQLRLGDIDSRFIQLGDIEDACLGELENEYGNGLEKYTKFSEHDCDTVETYHRLWNQEHQRLRMAGDDKVVIQDAYTELSLKWYKTFKDSVFSEEMVLYVLAGEPSDNLYSIILPTITLSPTNEVSWRHSLLHSPLWIWQIIEQSLSRFGDEHTLAKDYLTENRRKILSDPVSGLSSAEVETIAVLWDHKPTSIFNDLDNLISSVKYLV